MACTSKHKCEPALLKPQAQWCQWWPLVERLTGVINHGSSLASQSRCFHPTAVLKRATGRVVSGTGYIKFPRNEIKTCQSVIKLPAGVVLLDGRARKGQR